MRVLMRVVFLGILVCYFLAPSPVQAYMSYTRVQACLKRSNDNYVLYHNVQANLENYLKVQLRADFLNKMNDDFRMAADCPEVGRIMRRYSRIVAKTIGQIDMITSLGVMDY